MQKKFTAKPKSYYVVCGTCQHCDITRIILYNNGTN